MKALIKALKLLGIILLMVLASFGMGIGGAVPVPKNRKEDTIEIVEAEEEAELSEDQFL